MVSFVVATESVRATVAVCVGELESVTLNVRGVAFTVVVGVPLTKPVDEFSVRPLGNVPEVSAQVYGVVPPEPVNVCE